MDEGLLVLFLGLGLFIALHPVNFSAKVLGHNWFAKTTIWPNHPIESKGGLGERTPST